MSTTSFHFYGFWAALESLCTDQFQPSSHDSYHEMEVVFLCGRKVKSGDIRRFTPIALGLTSLTLCQSNPGRAFAVVSQHRAPYSNNGSYLKEKLGLLFATSYSSSRDRMLIHLSAIFCTLVMTLCFHPQHFSSYDPQKVTLSLPKVVVKATTLQ
jgi:hypothetical protein